MKIEKKYNKWMVYGLFFCFFIVVEIFHSFLGLYFDDFGNASLSYGSDYGFDVGVEGMNWNLKDLLRWASWIYKSFSGRVMCGSLLNILVKLGNGPRLFMFLQGVIVTFIIWLIYKIVLDSTKRGHNIFIAIMTILLILWMPSDMYKWTLCWASASVLYVWPLAMFFSIICLLYNEKKSALKNEKVRLVILLIMTSLTAFSHEQTGFSTVVFVGTYSIYDYVQTRKINKVNLILLGDSLIFYALIFFAPGNWNRLAGNSDFSKLNFWEKIQFNYEPLLQVLFSKIFIFIYALITIILLIRGIYIWKKEKEKYLFEIACLSIMFFVGTYIANEYIQSSIMFVCCGTLYLVCIFFNLVCYNRKYSRDCMSILLFAAAGSAFCILLSPTLPLRCFTEWILVIDCQFIILACDLWYENIKEKKNILKLVYVAFALYIGYSGIKTGRFWWDGYSENKAVFEINDDILKAYSGNEQVELKKLENDFFAPVMPYNEGYDFIEYWMKEYYNIPVETQFIWKD